jgi:hypothetical protein
MTFKDTPAVVTLLAIAALISYVAGSMAAHRELMRLIPAPLRDQWDKQSREFALQVKAQTLQKEYLDLHPELKPSPTPAAPAASPIATPTTTQTPKK